MGEEILVVENLNTYSSASIGEEPTRILDRINVVINEGDILGLVGETGSGKSVLIDSIGQNLRNPLWMSTNKLLLSFDNKTVDLKKYNKDDMKSIWGKGICFIPPNARDNLMPILTVGQQFVNIIKAHLKISEREAKEIVIKSFKQVQMPAPERSFDSLPQTLSGGMAQRVIISIALFLSPRLLLADEPTMGLDVTIQKQVLDIFYILIKKIKSGVILATRDMGIVANYCNRVGVLCNGQLVEISNKREFFKNAKHPYSKYLLEAAFASHGKMLEKDFKKSVSKKVIEVKTEKGCRFANRCSLTKKECHLTDPPEVVIGPNHFIRCHRVEG
ncbi:oligopeptide/dipeptide ABC transporter ATP-binding protein [Actinomycetota bacterium]